MTLFQRVGFGCAIFVFLLGAMNTQPVRAQDSRRLLKFWIFLSDKPPAQEWRAQSSGDADHDQHALRRRLLRGEGEARSMSAPLSADYLAALKRQGVRPVVRSRWLNAVSARLTSKQLRRVEGLPFVSAVQPVARLLKPARSPGSVAEIPPDTTDGRYGKSRYQLAFINALAPLERGIDGRGVRLGFLDTKFGGFEHPVFDSLRASGRLLATKDFTEKPQNLNNPHGQSVVSAAAGFSKGRLVGPGHGAEVLAATTEYVPTETMQEEDYFVAGLEWLERRGADVVNISLGYTTFPDDSTYDYRPSDLDGDTGVTTRAVDRAAALGVTVVVAAGNEGCSSPKSCWYYVSTPADADSAIAVGAAAPDSSRASFSSLGPTDDGRRKPDVAALGSVARKNDERAGPYLAVREEDYAYENGTSFAAPQVAGVVSQMLQVNAALTPIEVRDILRETASRSAQPDNKLGWGIVNAEAAVRRAEDVKDGVEASSATDRVALSVQPPYPNPAAGRVTLKLHAAPRAGRLRLTVYDVLGRRVHVRERLTTPGASTVSFSVQGWPSGLYVYRVAGEASSATGTFAVVGD